MTKRRIKQFFNNPRFVKDNGAWWLGDVGFLLFDRSLLMLLGKDSDRPGLLLIHRIKDIPFLAYDQKKGVIIGTWKMRPDGD